MVVTRLSLLLMKEEASFLNCKDELLIAFGVLLDDGKFISLNI